MKFSVIVPAYNAEKTIKSCIASVLDQEYKDFELIVIDDGSTDDTAKKILEFSYEKKIKLKKIKNTGVSNARNIGIKEATGDFVVFLDADDKLTLNALKSYYEAISLYNDVDIVFGNFYKVYPNHKESFSILNKNIDKAAFGKTNIQFNPYYSRLIGTLWGKCYRRELLIKNYLDSELMLCEDAEYNFRVFPKTNNMLYINSYVYEYTYTADSTIRKYDPDYINKYINAIEKIKSNATQDRIRYVNEFSSTVLNVICFNVIFTNLNKSIPKDKINTARDVCEKSVFKQIISEVKLSDLSVKHRVSIWLLKKKLYFGIYLMSYVIQLMNKVIYWEG